jgi:hypothetical protein
LAKIKKPAGFYSVIISMGFILVLLWFPRDNLNAQQVDTEELKKGQLPSVNFLNYEGPHARIDSRTQIWNIGYIPGTIIRGGAQRTGGLARYFVIHSLSAPEENKLDADIFGLGIDTGVDHIRNLRLIIQGYLEGAYAYSAQDAALLAEYITIYNAVFRGNWDYFTSRYKTPVIQDLDRDKVGLSIRFDEWPGRTLIAIPLVTGQADSLSAVDTSALASPEVVDEMRKDDDMGIDRRREMVDLKEREAEEAEQRAALQREAVAEEESRLAQDQEEAAQRQEAIAQEREEAAREREAIEREREEISADEAAGDAPPEEIRRREEALEKREAELEKKTEELDKQEAEAEQEAEELKQREEALEEERAEIERTEEFAERKAAEAQREREEIAKDQQAIIGQEERPPEPEGILGVRLINAASPLGRLVKINRENGEELRVSGLDTVNIRTVTSIGGKLFMVAGENQGNGAIRIVEINADTLEIAQQGEDDIHPQSLIWVSGGDKLYAIISQEGVLRLARFSTELATEARSSVTVHAYATPVFQGDMVLIQRDDGSVAILNASDLSERE